MTQPPAITSTELQLIETSLERRNSFQHDVRRAMARQIAKLQSHRWSLPPETLQDSEKLHEALAEQTRNVAHFR